MQRGILKHYAYVLPQIFAERILWEPTDLPTVTAWGEGHLTIDIIHEHAPGGAENEGGGVVLLLE